MSKGEGKRDQQKTVLDRMGALEAYLAENEGERFREAYVKHLLEPSEERSMILTAHAVVERLLGEMISTHLSHPDVWLKESDFRSRSNLARAIGLIGESEYNICRVLNSIRNKAAHGLERIPINLRVELTRLVLGPNRSEINDDKQDVLRETLRAVLTCIMAPWLYARVSKARKDLLEIHKSRWMELMVAQLREHPEQDKALEDDEEAKELRRAVEEILVAELRASIPAT